MLRTGQWQLHLNILTLSIISLPVCMYAQVVVSSSKCECVCVCKSERKRERERAQELAAVCFEPSGKAGRAANPCGWPSRKAIHIYSWLNHILSYRCPILRPRTRITSEQNRNMGLKEIQTRAVFIACWVTLWYRWHFQKKENSPIKPKCSMACQMFKTCTIICWITRPYIVV